MTVPSFDEARYVSLSSIDTILVIRETECKHQASRMDPSPCAHAMLVSVASLSTRDPLQVKHEIFQHNSANTIRALRIFDKLAHLGPDMSLMRQSARSVGRGNTYVKKRRQDDTRDPRDADKPSR